MIYRVGWDENALDGLALVYLAATDRASITRAATEVDRLLEREPLMVGSEFSEGLQLLLVGPLSVTYSVDPTQRSVLVESAGTAH